MLSYVSSPKSSKSSFSGVHFSNFEGGFYTSKQWDEDVELYYFNARWYDPETGRFITEDPIRDGTGWYSYCSSNPMNRIDPTGLEETQIYRGFEFTRHTEYSGIKRFSLELADCYIVSLRGGLGAEIESSTLVNLGITLDLGSTGFSWENGQYKTFDQLRVGLNLGVGFKDFVGLIAGFNFTNTNERAVHKESQYNFRTKTYGEQRYRGILENAWDTYRGKSEVDYGLGLKIGEFTSGLFPERDSTRIKFSVSAQIGAGGELGLDIDEIVDFYAQIIQYIEESGIIESYVSELEEDFQNGKDFVNQGLLNLSSNNVSSNNVYQGGPGQDYYNYLQEGSNTGEDDAGEETRIIHLLER